MKLLFAADAVPGVGARGGVTRERLYARHTGLAAGIARSEYHRVPGLDLDDVVQEALIALWLATGTWDPDRAPFPGWARVCVHGRIVSLLRASGRDRRRALNEAVGLDHERVPAVDLEAQLDAREQLRDLIARGPELARQRAEWRAQWARKRARRLADLAPLCTSCEAS